MQQLLAQVDRSVTCAKADNIDDYVVYFNKISKETVDNYTPVCKMFKKHIQHYPKQKIKLIHLKRHE